MEIKKEGRGAIAEILDKNKSQFVTAWFDNKRVSVISNFDGRNPIGECVRYDRKNLQKVAVARPATVQIYNSSMGGVDKADMLLSLYRTEYRTRT